MAITNLDTAGNILHIYYTRYLTSQSNDRTNVRDMLLKESKKFDGSHARIGLMDSYPVTGGPRGPSATIPDAVPTDVTVSDIFLTYHYYPIEIAWDVEEQSSGEHSWIRASAMEVDRVRKWSLINFEMNTVLDGTGVLAGGAATDGTYTNLAKCTRTSETPLTFTVSTTYGVRFVKGMRLEFYANPTANCIVIGNDATVFVKRAGPSVTQSYFTIDTVSHSGGTTTIVCVENTAGGATDPFDTGNGDFVTQEGALFLATAPAPDEWWTNWEIGIEGLVNVAGTAPNRSNPLRPNAKPSGIQPSASFLCQNKAQSGFWQSLYVDAANGILGPGIFEQSNVELQQVGSKGIEDIDFCLTHPRQVSKFRRQLMAAIRFQVSGGDSPELPGGAASSTAETRKYIHWGHIPLVPSRFANPIQARLINKDTIKVFENTAFKFYTGDGAMWHRNPNSLAASRAVAYKYECLGILSRNSNLMIDHLDSSNN